MHLLLILENLCEPLSICRRYPLASGWDAADFNVNTPVHEHDVDPKGGGGRVVYVPCGTKHPRSFPKSHHMGFAPEL